MDRPVLRVSTGSDRVVLDAGRDAGAPGEGSWLAFLRYKFGSSVPTGSAGVPARIRRDPASS